MVNKPTVLALTWYLAVQVVAMLATACRNSMTNWSCLKLHKLTGNLDRTLPRNRFPLLAAIFGFRRGPSSMRFA
uniref:Putative secreted protein n=1 Tax=Anopheles marajoara TaxID=58244 RepID=A0A2M4CDC8_9DIPT